MIKPDYSFRNKKILVTGGAGFIGSNLCEYLLSCNAIVTCLDNLSTGSEQNIKEFLNNPNFNFINGNIEDISTCNKACKGKDFVLHQAALGSVPRSIKDPAKSNKTNISGFLNMLIASKDNKIKRFIFAASSSTYGDSEELPKNESNIGKPLSPYAITKYVNELYAEVFQRVYGLDFIGLRYFNVFGRKQSPRGAYAAVIPIFIKKLMNYESPVINGDGTFSRDFTYIDNVIQMNILSMKTENNKAINQIYNTACGERTTLIELVKYLKKHLSSFEPKIINIEPIHGPSRIGDIPHSLASIEKASNLLNYQPTHYIDKGLYETIKWFKNNYVK